MALQEKFINWVAKNSRIFDIRLTQQTWIQEWIPGHFSYKASIVFDSKKFTGMGSDPNADLAGTKAIVEAIERVFKHVRGLYSTSGLSAHVDLSSAEDHARLELHERDAFFCHFLSKSPFEKIFKEGDFEQVDSLISRLSEKSRSCGVRLEYRKLKVPHGLYGVICAAFGSECHNPFGTILGLSCTGNLYTSILKASIECLTNVTAQFENKLDKEISLSEFSKIDLPWVNDHFRLGLWSGSAESLSELFKNPPTGGNPIKGSPETETLADRFQEMNDCPLYFVQAHSRDAQRAYFGHLSIERVNLSRLSQFAGREIKWEDLPSFPHVMG